MDKQKRLLVVDDQIEITDLIREIAENEGCEVHAINDSTSFFDRFEDINPDVLCIDIHMPDVDGIEILRWLSNRHCSARVIILSGGDPLFTKVAERIGEAASLTVQTLIKPFRLDEFRTVLNATGPNAKGTPMSGAA